jgi:hypothetical protein
VLADQFRNCYDAIPPTRNPHIGDLSERNLDPTADVRQVVVEYFGIKVGVEQLKFSRCSSTNGKQPEEVENRSGPA